MNTNLRKPLVEYKAGRISIEDVEGALPGANDLFFENIENLLIGNAGCLDPYRVARAGVPEAICAKGKQLQEVVEFLRAMVVGPRFENGSILPFASARLNRPPAAAPAWPSQGR